MYVLLGSSTSDASSPFSRRIRNAVPDFEARGISGASVPSWIAKVRMEPTTTYQGQNVVVYLPGQVSVPSAASIRQLTDLVMARGAASVQWVLPPKFPTGVKMNNTNTDREQITGGSAAAILAAGVGVLNRSRLVLRAAEVAGDGVHLTVAGQNRLADSLIPLLSSPTTGTSNPAPSEPLNPATVSPSAVAAGGGILTLVGILAGAFGVYMLLNR
jgi:hypothetical protein